MNGSWSERSDLPLLQENEAHCWLAHLPAQRALLGHAERVLSADERERIAKFRFEAHRERALLTRAILRWLLGGCLDIPPGEIAFRYGPHGKPELETGDLRFNTSHSGDYAAFVLTRAGDAGVDIEQVRDHFPRRDDIAARHFAAGEQAQLRALPEPDRQRAFFDLWTRKEAFVKARGDGLFSGLDRFEMSLREPRVVGVDGDASKGAEWRVLEMPCIEGYSGAVVVRASSIVPRFWNWTAPLAGRLIDSRAEAG
jgi:4'-phosphopantetheinyl transferase